MSSSKAQPPPSSSTAAQTAPDGSPAPPVAPRYSLSKPVFLVSAGIILLAVLFALLLPDAFNAAISTLNTTVVNSIGWYYVLVVTAFVFFAIVIAASRMGQIKLGKDDDEPEFSMFSWFAMLFAAGMGIGLVFWGAAEPLTFYSEAGAPPNAAGLADPDRAERALGQTFLHWGLHAWGIYVIVGLAVAYAVHRKDRPVSIRWALEPILGKRTDTWIGDVIDIIALVGTLFGIATSLGFGVNQIAAGLDHLGVLPNSTAVQVIIILVVTALATLSAASGVDKGIKILSNLNMGLAALLLLTVLILGPTLFLLRDVVSNIGYYLQNFLQLSFQTLPFRGEEGATWISSWTTFYWGWWISWSPFVGVFIARISKGRTVREFITGVLLVPTALTFLWFTVMGGTALYESVIKGVDFTGGTGEIDPNTALFDTFAHLPAGALLSGIAVILVSIFFITSADSGAFVMDMIAHKGDPNPPRLTRIFWASASGVIAASLIWVSSLSADGDSGMEGLQALALLSALPFSVVMIGMAISLWRSLSREVMVIERLERRLRQREFMERYSDQLTDEVSGRVEDRFAEQVEAQVSEHLSTYTGEVPILPADGGDSAPGGRGGRRRLPRNPFSRDS
ncbi:choline transporter [Brachybacterium ginsengisoli]|uniref:Choline transporter n=1 Tax=Brachybacterium ginsengisoli TaxID=1331682 RepID=A0A291GZU3_9MICO|nr:BCCT family transporter [Brachybacterium ginsengisoli]ATG55700.1 choline transporter [Brachybacterium ginsengisoli]